MFGMPKLLAVLTHCMSGVWRTDNTHTSKNPIIWGSCWDALYTVLALK
jgi:hypothetical protein